MISLPGRAGARRKIAAGMAVGLTLGAIAVVHTQVVGAATKTTPVAMTCTVLGSPSAVTTNITTTFTPDPLHSGDTVVLDIVTAPPTGVPLDVPVTAVGITIPIPAQVDLSQPSSVVLTGGNLTGSSTVSGSNLRINLTGSGVTAFNLQIPKMTVTSKLKAGIGGQTINWVGPTNLDITATVIGPLQVPCTSAGTIVATAVVAADATTTTAAPTTATTRPATTATTRPATTATTRPATTATTRPATTATTRPATTATTRPATTATTRPATTATTRAPTTVTTRPPATTATTRPATTATTRPATTVTTRPPATTATTRATTRPPTTRPPATRPPTTRPSSHLPPFLQRLLCLLFHLGC
jgi:hypothetical protein